MQELIVDEMKRYNANLHITVGKADAASQLVCDIERKYEAEYTAFFKERKKWKSDFKTATEKAVNNFNAIEDIIKRTLNENATNTNALKLVLDAIMIDQLIFRQDVEDRKEISVMGIKQSEEQKQSGHARKASTSPTHINVDVKDPSTLQPSVGTQCENSPKMMEG
jgi:hypothetical protein